MIGSVRGAELQPGVGLHILTGYPGRPTIQAVAVATETNLVFELGTLHYTAINVHPLHTSKRAADGWGRGSRVAGRVGIVAIGTLHVPRRVDGIFGGTVNTGSKRERMDAGLVELCRDILRRNRTAMTGVTILLFVRKIQQLGFCARVMRTVTVLARVGSNGGLLGVRPGIDTRAAPSGD